MKRFAAIVGVMLLGGWCYGLPTNDDFNSATENTTNWGPDLVTDNGTLELVDGQLQFSVTGTPTVFDQSVRPWKVSRGPYTSDWEVQVDTFNSVVVTSTNQQVATGITISDGVVSSNEIIVTQFSGGSDIGTSLVGFVGRLGGLSNGVYVTALGITSTNGAVRIVFDSTTKVVTLYYDADHSGGYSWTPFGSYGINGSGGSDGNMSWAVSDTNQIQIGIYGFAANTAVSSNEVALDNFETTGLVAPYAVHDLAVTSIKAPKSISLSAKKPSITKKATVTIQNVGPVAEQITADNVTNLVTFQLQSLAPATCTPPVPVLLMPTKLPVNLVPKKSMTLSYNITFDCANNPGKGTNDFSYTATVNTSAIDGTADTNPGNDVCPRDPSGTDKGCGGKNPDRTLGANVVTDVIMK